MSRKRYEWSQLNHLQIGRYAEYFVKMELTMYGLQVYTTEVDDRGIDFVARYNTKPFLEIQVKSMRGLKYVFLPKQSFTLSPTVYAALVILYEYQIPELYLIPSTVWQTPNALFVDHDYEGKKSLPEWGINLSRKNLPLLNEYTFDKTIHSLIT